MAPKSMKAHITEAAGFLAALDQSGGSTPGALRLYGIPESAYSGEAEMFARIHEMRVRVMTAPAFTGDKVIGAILFERTMDGEVQGKPAPSYLWEDRGCVPFLKVDKGLEAEADGVSLMRPIPELDTLLDRAVSWVSSAPKCARRSTCHPRAVSQRLPGNSSRSAHRSRSTGWFPFFEPEVLIKSPDKPKSEALLKEALARHLDALPSDHQVMLKLTIPDVPDLYKDLIAHDRVVRVVALSGGYSRADACQRWPGTRRVRQLLARAARGAAVSISDAAFNAALAHAIDEIYTASTVKV